MTPICGYCPARDAVDRLFTKVSQNPQLNAQPMEKFRRDLLRSAKEFHERFIQEQSQAPEVRHDLGLAHTLDKSRPSSVHTFKPKSVLTQNLADREFLPTFRQ